MDAVLKRDDSWEQRESLHAVDENDVWKLDSLEQDCSWYSLNSNWGVPENGLRGNSEGWSPWESTSRECSWPCTSQSRPGSEFFNCSGWSDALNDPAEAALPEEERTNDETGKNTDSSSIGAGLQNMGNTCFLNSVLQCLTYTPPIANYLQNSQHKASCLIDGFCTMCTFEDHVKQALSSPGRVISPSVFVNNLTSISSSFHLWQQEDAHECLLYLIEALHKCCISKSSCTSSETSFVSSIFGGCMRSQVKCTSCFHCSDTFDPFLDLSLEIEKSNSLLDALACFTAVEAVEGENKYQCIQCKQEVSASKQLTIYKPPEVLAIQLKCFNASGAYGTKIDKCVDFDFSLDLKPFISDAQNDDEHDFKYTLYAVLVHSGWSTTSGHYYCFVCTSGTWHILNDSWVKKVSQKTVLEQKAYMLFYVRDCLEGCFGLEPNMSKPSRKSSSLSFGSALLKPVARCDPKEQTHADYYADKTSVDSGGVQSYISTGLETKQVSNTEVMAIPSLPKVPCSLNEINWDSLWREADGDNRDMPATQQSMPSKDAKLSPSRAGKRPTLVRSHQDFAAIDDFVEAQMPEQSREFGHIHLGESEAPAACKVYPSHEDLTSVGNKHVLPDTSSQFQRGMAQSYIRILKCMPSNRRAGLQSALPSQTDGPLVNLKSVGGNKRLLQVKESGKASKYELVVNNKKPKRSEEGTSNFQNNTFSPGLSVGRIKSNKAGKIVADQCLDDVKKMDKGETADIVATFGNGIQSKSSNPFPGAAKDREDLLFTDPQSCMNDSQNEVAILSSTSLSTENRTGADLLTLAKVKSKLQELMWAEKVIDEEHGYAGSKKLPRGGAGKRIIASPIDNQGYSCNERKSVPVGDNSKLSRYFQLVTPKHVPEDVSFMR